MEWQPIETAPKDGSHILILRSGHPDEYGTNIVNVFWGDRLAGYAPDDPANYAWLNWHEGFEYNETGALWATVENPTHWMPLPKAPQAHRAIPQEPHTPARSRR